MQQMHPTNDPENVEKITLEERESRLWSASKQYMLGEINEEQLGNVEQWLRIKDELYAGRIRSVLATSITIIFIMWTLLGLVSVVVTGNAWLLLGTGILVLPLSAVLRYYFK